MTTILLSVSAFLYFLSILITRFKKWIVLTGFTIHTLTIISVFVHSGGFPTASLSSSILLFTWTMVLLWLLLSMRFNIVLLGNFTVPLVFLFLLISIFLPKRVNTIIQSNWFTVHSTISIIGFAGFGFAFVAGIVYLIMEREIKSRHPHTFSGDIPSLEVLDLVGYRALGFGFLFLTLGMVLGALWLKRVKGVYWTLDPKLMWTLLTWLFYAGLLHIRFTATWRGKKVAILYIIGFLFVAFTFIVVNYLFFTFHSF